jgi:glycosyltransferase involved in cell wall biosynthesis
MAGRPRVAVLWEALNGYMRSVFQALMDEGADLLVVHRDVLSESPFDEELIASGIRTESWMGSPDTAGVDEALRTFQPHVLLVASWHIGPYRKVARRLRGRTLRILAISNQWLATPKQRAGVLVAPLVIRPTYDAALVCDERQAVFAERLGFPAERLLWGMNTCDHPLYSGIAARRGDALPPKAFLFVGRLVEAKAVDVLAAAYTRYRDLVRHPWPLLVAGIGPLDHLLQGQQGVEMLGFVQPDQLPVVFERAGCLVLPSRYEPWGVVIHEAAAAGIPVICSRACGASTRLVLDGYNGVVVSPGREEALATGLVRIHDASDDERRAMGVASETLAHQYSPQRWAQNLLRRAPELRAEVGLSAMT